MGRFRTGEESDDLSCNSLAPDTERDLFHHTEELKYFRRSNLFLAIPVKSVIFGSFYQEEEHSVFAFSLSLRALR